MGNSPAAVEAYLAMSGALAKGVLPASTREKIAITCAEVHVCEYCLSAHYAIAKSIGMSEAELDEARNERSDDPKENAILGLVRSIITNRGEINDNAWREYRDAGLTDAEIAEVIAHVGLNTFTNYFNKVAQTEVDFPKIKTAFPV
jgi:AhpD family alkylhydroperoxidase